MYYPRHLQPVLQKLSAQFPVVLLTGARQVGKSTLLQHIAPEYGYAGFGIATAAATGSQQAGAQEQGREGGEGGGGAAGNALRSLRVGRRQRGQALKREFIMIKTLVKAKNST